MIMPSKDNLHNGRKGKQHKASCKTKLVNSVTKPLHTLHMDLFGPTSDETSGILWNFITEIENLKDLKVKIIMCDNRGEFRNKEMNDFCSKKEINREFSNAKTPQQNGVAERKNRTLIEAARTIGNTFLLAVAFFFRQWEVPSGSGNFLTSSENALCILFPTCLLVKEDARLLVKEQSKL
nr:hypothetical protein [Tanacetum cinerariifolium]